MKLKNITYISTLAVASLALGACSDDFLDTPTDTRVELVTTEQLAMLMGSAYPVANYAWPLELMSDNMEDNNSPDENDLRYNLSPYDRGDDEMFRWEQCVSNTDTDSPSAIWEAFYKSTAAANVVLQTISSWQKNGHDSTLTVAQRALKGEALVLRAYNHFILAQVFCQPYRGSLSAQYQGIPYITSPETTVKPDYKRGTLKDTYAKIQADLEAGLPLIANGSYEVPKYHFNTAAANAFAARFYLFTRQYQKALDHANAAFGGAEVDVTPFLCDVWSKLDNFYYISEFGLYINSINRSSNFLLYPTYSVALRRFDSGRRYGVVRDARSATIYGSSPAWADFKWRNNNGKGGTFTMHPAFNGCCINNGKAEYGTAMCVNVSEQFEYTDKVAGIGFPHVTRREFYGDETLLVRAEAKLFLGDKIGALADIDKWEKARRDCPSAAGYEDVFTDYTFANIEAFYGTDKGKEFGICKDIHIDQICPESDAKADLSDIMPMLQCVQHLRRIETIHTGMRWFDIKRFGLEFDRKIGKNGHDHLAIEDPRKAVQIPPEVAAAGLTPSERPTQTSTPKNEYILVR